MSLFPDHIADRYRRFKFRHFAPNMDHYEELASQGQSPDVLVVSCCDSRVDPETIFSAMPGELFVVRNVANLVPPYETGGKFHGVSTALEYGVLALRVKHVIIMGHSGCGGVKAVVDRASTPPGAVFINRWITMLDDAHMRVASKFQGSSRAGMLEALERESLKTSLANLRTFPFVIEAESKGRLALHGAYFDIKAGQLSVLNQATGEFYTL